MTPSSLAEKTRGYFEEDEFQVHGNGSQSCRQELRDNAEKDQHRDSKGTEYGQVPLLLRRNSVSLGFLITGVFPSFKSQVTLNLLT